MTVETYKDGQGTHLKFHQKKYAEQLPDIEILRGRLSDGVEALTEEEHENYLSGLGQIGWMAVVSCPYFF